MACPPPRRRHRRLPRYRITQGRIDRRPGVVRLRVSPQDLLGGRRRQYKRHRRNCLRAAAPGSRSHGVADGARSRLHPAGHNGLAGARNRQRPHMAGTPAEDRPHPPDPRALRDARRPDPGRRTLRHRRRRAASARPRRSTCRWTRPSMPPPRRRRTCWRRWRNAGFPTSKAANSLRRSRNPVAQAPLPPYILCRGGADRPPPHPARHTTRAPRQQPE